jgi:beta-1,4-mannosyltransferase
VVVVPLGDYRCFYRDSLAESAARERLECAPEHVVFLCLGTIRANRNPLGVLRAFRSLAGSHLRLLVMGQCHDRFLRAKIIGEASEDNRVHIRFDRLPVELLEAALKACDVVIMPGKQLTSAVVVLAISYGRPVIAPDYGCTSDYVKGAGFLYRNDGDLAGALRAAAEADLAAYKRRANDAAKGLSWDAAGVALRGAYDNAIGP